MQRAKGSFYSLFTLSDTDSDPDLGTDFCPRNGYSNDRGYRSGSEFESESESVQ